jgi:hypothetical protein
LQVLVVTAGVVIFNFGAPVKAGKGGQSDSAYGLALIAFSLALDGATGGIQVCSRSFNAFFRTRFSCSWRNCGLLE